MKKTWMWIAVLGLPLAAAGAVWGSSIVKADRPQKDAGFVCPLTGEKLPCPNCCPANK